MNKNSLDPLATFEEARSLSLEAHEAMDNNLDDVAIKKLKKSSRILMKILTDMSDSSNLIFPPELDRLDIRDMLKSLISLVYQFLGENYGFLLQIYLGQNNFIEGKKYIKLTDQFLKNATEYEKTNEIYNFYLEAIIDSLIILSNFDEDNDEVKYLRRYLDIITESIQFGFDPKETAIYNAEIAINRYKELINNNQSYLAEAIDTVFDVVCVKSLSSEELKTLNWFNFSIFTLTAAIQRYPNLISEKESTINNILKTLLNNLTFSELYDVIDEDDSLKTVLSILYHCGKSFKDLNNSKDIFELNLDLIEATGLQQKTNEIVLSLENAIDIIHSKPELKSDFELLKLYNRLIGQLGISGKLALAKEDHEIILTLLSLVNVNDILRDHRNYNKRKAEIELKLVRAESYYFLASNEVESHNYDKGKAYLLKAADYLNDVDWNYSSNLKTNLTNLIFSLEKYLSDLTGQQSFFD